MIDGGLRTCFRIHLPHFHWQSIESGLTGGGIPDSNACYKGQEFWIEFKKTDRVKIASLHPDQVGWHLRRYRAGGRTFFAVRFRHAGGPRKGAPIDRLLIYRGRDAKDLLLHGLNVSAALSSGDKGPSSWDWKAVEALLLGKFG